MGQQIPTLEEVLEFAAKHDVIFYLEIKYDAAWGMHHALVGAIQKAQSAARTIIISFDEGTLKALRQADSTIMMGLLIDKARKDSVKATTQMGARQLCPKFGLVTKDLVERAHRVDLQVATWTVDDTQTMRAMVDAGVDGIMTDFPDRLQMLLEDRSSEVSQVSEAAKKAPRIGAK
jgi:glycerophosphoryl diester phosphodiesterase